MLKTVIFYWNKEHLECPSEAKSELSYINVKINT